jgi:hypothetical protein
VARFCLCCHARFAVVFTAVWCYACTVQSSACLTCNTRCAKCLKMAAVRFRNFLAFVAGVNTATAIEFLWSIWSPTRTETSMFHGYFTAQTWRLWRQAGSRRVHKLRKATISFIPVCPLGKTQLPPDGFWWFDIWDFFENLSGICKFRENPTRITDTLHDQPTKGLTRGRRR